MCGLVMTSTTSLLSFSEITCRSNPPSRALLKHCAILAHRTCNLPYARPLTCQARQLCVLGYNVRLKRVYAASADTEDTSAHATSLLQDFGNWFLSNGALTALFTPYAQ